MLTVALVCSAITTAYAHSYYNLTAKLSDGTNLPDGATVPFGSVVTVTATTNDPNAYKVKFYWVDPAHNPVPPSPEEIHLSSGGTKSASSSRTLDKIGDWDVHVVFYDEYGHSCGTYTVPVKCRSISFNVVPEIPVLGTAGASAVMLLGLAFKLKRKPKEQKS